MAVGFYPVEIVSGDSRLILLIFLVVGQGFALTEALGTGRRIKAFRKVFKIHTAVPRESWIGQQDSISPFRRRYVGKEIGFNSMMARLYGLVVEIL